MATLSDLMDYTAPETTVERRRIWDPLKSPGSPDRYREEYRYDIDTDLMRYQMGQAGDALDELLEGYDAKSLDFETKLKSIYDGYVGNLEQYGADMQPIMDAIEGDIQGFESFMGGYEELLGGMEGDFLNSILVDPNAARTRAEYMGNVAAQYDQAEGAMRRQAIQQGINPYANRGAAREMALDRAGAMAGAANQAYGDWREQYNRDVQRQQAANEAYANLYGRKGEMYGDLLSGRGMLLGATQGMYDTRLEAERLKAQGYEGLMDRNEARRTQALELGQAQRAQQIQALERAGEMQMSTPQQWFEGRNTATDFAPNYPSF